MAKQKKNNNIYVSHYNTIDIPSGFKIVSLSDFDKIKDNTTKEIFIKDIIGGFNDNNIVEFIKRAIDKLTIGGIIYIQDLDIEQISIYLSQKVLPISNKNMLYNNGRKNIFYLRYLLNILNKIPNIELEQVNFVNGYEFLIKAKKHG